MGYAVTGCNMLLCSSQLYCQQEWDTSQVQTQHICQHQAALEFDVPDWYMSTMGLVRHRPTCEESVFSSVTCFTWQDKHPIAAITKSAGTPQSVVPRNICGFYQLLWNSRGSTAPWWKAPRDPSAVPMDGTTWGHGPSGFSPARWVLATFAAGASHSSLSSCSKSVSFPHITHKHRVFAGFWQDFATRPLALVQTGPVLSHLASPRLRSLFIGEVEPCWTLWNTLAQKKGVHTWSRKAIINLATIQVGLYPHFGEKQIKYQIPI
jgi:hypothetical protein